MDLIITRHKGIDCICVLMPSDNLQRQYLRTVGCKCWQSVCVCVKVVTAFMKHVMSHVSGWTDGTELIDAGWSGSNAVWLVAYRM